LIQTKPNITKIAAAINVKLTISLRSNQLKNMVKMGLKKEKLATPEAG
jgi:hypothetical protein